MAVVSALATAIPSALTAPARASSLRQAGGSDASREIKGGTPRGKPPLTPHLISLRRALHRKFFKVLSSAKNKCSHCYTHSCAMRTEGGYKIFCVPLSARAAAANQILGGDIAARVAGRGGSASLVHPGVVDVRGRPHFSRFDPRPGRPHSLRLYSRVVSCVKSEKSRFST